MQQSSCAFVHFCMIPKIPTSNIQNISKFLPFVSSQRGAFIILLQTTCMFINQEILLTNTMSISMQWKHHIYFRFLFWSFLFSNSYNHHTIHSVLLGSIRHYPLICFSNPIIKSRFMLLNHERFGIWEGRQDASTCSS